MIHIFYRHYEIQGNDNKGRPSWFNFEKCFVNFLDSIEGEDVNLHVVMDGKASNNFISKYSNKFILHEYVGGNDFASAMFSYKLAYSIVEDPNDLIYFVENDYLHIKGWVNKITTLFSTYSNINYVSLYDHNDKYFLPMYDDLASKIFTTVNHHWRTTPSTCGTYIIKNSLFREDYDIHLNLQGDHNKYLWLNEHKHRFVLTPIPGLSTHCMEGLMSPTIDWSQV
jgi:hypothetical protein